MHKASLVFRSSIPSSSSRSLSSSSSTRCGSVYPSHSSHAPSSTPRTLRRGSPLGPLSSQLRFQFAPQLTPRAQTRTYLSYRGFPSKDQHHMAWYSSGQTNVELIENMRNHGLIKSDRVAEAMKKVDRANYVVDKKDAYFDSPQSIGYGATISAPHMHAHACENLLPFLKPDSKVLDVGSGSGYTCAVFHQLVGKGGKVVGIDHIPQLVEWSVSNLKRDGLTKALEEEEIEMITGDGRQGYEAGGPYDAIHVGAAAPTLPQALVDQLACPGRMFIPVGEHSQQILQVDKDSSGNVSQKETFDVRYVPLTDKERQWGK